MDSAAYASGKSAVVLGNTGNLIRIGFVFSNWNTKADGSGTSYAVGGSMIVSADTTLYARWVAEGTPTFTIAFNSGGGSTVASLYGMTGGSKVTKPTDPTLSGSTFAGWYTDTTYATAWNFTTDSITGNLTLYAKWNPDPPTGTTSTVTFQANGGSAVASQTVATGSKITKPTDPTLSGSTFAGWYTDTSYATAWNFTTDSITGNMTLFAKWTTSGTGSGTGVLMSNASISVYIDSATAFTSMAYGTQKLVKALIYPTVTSSGKTLWYLDGILDNAQTSSSWTTPATLSKGPHSLMVIVNESGLVGSAVMYFSVQ